MPSERQHRIQQIIKLEAKQAKKWHVGVQKRIDRLRDLTGLKKAIIGIDGKIIEDVYCQRDAEESHPVGPRYIEPSKRLAVEYAAYLGNTK